MNEFLASLAFTNLASLSQDGRGSQSFRGACVCGRVLKDTEDRSPDGSAYAICALCQREVVIPAQVQEWEEGLERDSQRLTG